eukprot:jgi/Astpho2/508/Aster-x0930
MQLGRKVDEGLSHGAEGCRRVWGNLLPTLNGSQDVPDASCLQEAPLVAGNLETAITTETRKLPKAFNFKMSPSNIPALKEANVQFVSLANNHCLDYGQAGLLETQQALDEAGIAHAGRCCYLCRSGLKADAIKPAVVQHGSLKVAFLSMADHYADWAATDEVPGIWYVDPAAFPAAALSKAVVAAKALADLVVFFIHWGPNWAWRPDSHHIQGVEVYRGCPIIYGAGGAIDDYALDKDYRNDCGFLYQVELRDGRPHQLELLPLHIQHDWVTPLFYVSTVGKASGADRTWVCTKMKELCAQFGTKVLDQAGGDGLLVPLGG